MVSRDVGDYMNQQESIEEDLPKKCKNCFYANEYPECPKFCPDEKEAEKKP